MKDQLEDKVKYMSYGFDPKYFQIRNGKDLYVNRGTVTTPRYELLAKNYEVKKNE